MPTESAAVPGRIKPAELRAMDRQTFVAAFGEIFEHSPWVAEEAWQAGPFDDAGREAVATDEPEDAIRTVWVESSEVRTD